MRSRRPAVLAMPVVLAASQVGHLLATELRQGPHALAPAHSGAHAYIPMLTAIALGAGGAVVMAALVLVAAARLSRVRPRGTVEPPRYDSLLDLCAALFAAQLAIFLVQETVESLVYGSAIPTAGSLLLWGSLGQLPLAGFAALLLRSLLARVEAAVDDLSASAGRPLVAGPALAPVQLAFTSVTWCPPRRTHARARGKRAPPRLLRLQPIT